MRKVRRTPTTSIATTALLFGLFAVGCADQPPPEAVEDGEAAGGASAAEAGNAMESEADAAQGAEHGEEHEGEEHREGVEHDGGGEHGEGRTDGEHSQRGEHGEEGEESGDYIGRDANWDTTRRGMRLTLSYDAARDAFTGTVHNTTETTICAVRVEVHLGGGPELGPTERQDLAAGESVAVTLRVDGESFASWTAHPESSACGGA